MAQYGLAKDIDRDFPTFSIPEEFNGYHRGLRGDQMKDRWGKK